MGKLTELIKRARRTDPAPMGFGPAARKPSATLLLGAIAGDRWARSASDAVEAGAEVVLLTGRPGGNDVNEALAAAGDVSCGVLASDASADQLQRFQEAGLDFVILGPNAPAAATVDQKLSLVFHLRDDLSDIHLRALEALPFEAIYVERDPTAPTIMRLIEMQRIAGLARKPLLLQIPTESQQRDLVALRDAGAVVAAIDMKERNAIESLRSLRTAIDTLPRARVRRDERVSVSLPHSHGESEGEDEEDDE